MQVQRLGRRLRGGERDIGCELDFFFHLLLDRFELLFRSYPLTNQVLGIGGQRISARFLFPFCRWLVESLVVGKRVRVGSNDMCVEKGRSLTGPAVCDSSGNGVIGRQRIAPIDLFDV